MRIIVAAALVLTCVAHAGCGSGGLPQGGEDLTAPRDLVPPQDLTQPPVDLSVPPDLTAPQDLYDPRDFSGIGCGAQSCTGGNMCCAVLRDGGQPTAACMPACPDGGVAAACDGPEDCAGTSPICCADIELGPGQLPNCPIAARSSCRASCSFKLGGLSCPTTGVLRLCHRSADCAGDPNASTCCELRMGGASLSACVTDLLAAVLKGRGAVCF